MSPFRRTLCLGLAGAIIGLMICPPVTGAESKVDKANWHNLEGLVSGQQVQVVLNDAKSFQGKFESVSDEAIVIQLATGEQRFDRQSILRVSSKGMSHRARNAALGAAIGAGAGAAIGAATANSQGYCCGRGVTTAVGAGLGLVVGVGVGAALPTGRWQEVYRAH